jgi:hypothetical protein
VVGGLTNGKPYAFRARAVGLAGAGGWGGADVARVVPAPLSAAQRRRNARAVADERAASPRTAVEALSATRPVTAAAHAAFGGGADGCRLVINRSLGQILLTQNKALDLEYEVRRRAQRVNALGSFTFH